MATVRNLSETVKSKFLQLSGGTMVGNVKFDLNDAVLYRGDNSGRTIIRGGNSAFASGSSLYLSGKDHSSLGGAFQIYAHDGTNDIALRGDPNGTLTWGGNSILTSSNTTRITQSWHSGNNWYRKYSDGFLEQGGFLAQNGSSGTVTFNTPFTAVPTVVFQRVVGVCENCLSAVTASNFTWVSNTSRNGTTYWNACGY